MKKLALPISAASIFVASAIHGAWYVFAFFRALIENDVETFSTLMENSVARQWITFTGMLIAGALGITWILKCMPESPNTNSLA